MDSISHERQAFLALAVGQEDASTPSLKVTVDAGSILSNWGAAVSAGGNNESIPAVTMYRMYKKYNPFSGFNIFPKKFYLACELTISISPSTARQRRMNIAHVLIFFTILARSLPKLTLDSQHYKDCLMHPSHPKSFKNHIPDSSDLPSHRAQGCQDIGFHTTLTIRNGMAAWYGMKLPICRVDAKYV